MGKESLIAVIITCHNRKAKTLKCLTLLFSSILPANFKIKVFLVDDGSTDGTGYAVKSQFPEVKVINGTGNLFWNQGMRLAWETASKSNNFDFYIWLNDDTLLFNNSIAKLFDCYLEILEKHKIPALITGACSSSDRSNDFSYGGRTEKGPVVPNGELQMCTYINGNIVLVPRTIFKSIGLLSSDYTHAMGDYDYGLRVIKAGFNCFTTKDYVAICPNDKGTPGWCDPKNSLALRWELMYSPRGLNLKEYNIFRKKFWGWKWIIYAFKAYLRVLFPTFFNVLKNIT